MIVSPIITGDYTIIPNALLNSSRISPIAKILWQIIKAKGAKWNVYNEYIANELGVSVTTLKKYIAQLISSGWISRTQRRNPKTGKLLGGYDYILHSSPSQSAPPKNLPTDSVDNNERFNSFDYSIAPNRQKLAPNKELKNNNIENNKPPVVGLSASVEPVNNTEFIDEIELAAANQYVDQQSGVRDRAAYLACTLRNGWHKPLLDALTRKKQHLVARQEMYNFRKKYKKLTETEISSIKQKINTNLSEISLLIPVKIATFYNAYHNLLRSSKTDSISPVIRDSYSQFQWYFWLISQGEDALKAIERPLIEGHVAAFQIAKILCSHLQDINL